MNVIRFYTRDLSQLERAGSMTALDRLKRIELRDSIEDSIQNIVILIGNNQGPVVNLPFQPLLIMCGLALAYILEYLLLLIPRKTQRRQLVRRNRRIDHYDEYRFREKFGFNKWEAKDIMKCWQVFDQPIRFGGDGHGGIINGEEAFLIYMNRMHDYKKLTSMEEEFGIDYTQLSKIFNQCCFLMATTHFDLLFNNLDFFRPRFQMYNDAIQWKCNQIFGHGLPHRCRFVCGFQDGTRVEISRPGGDEQVQRRVYNGNDRIHCLEFQGFSYPDGIIGDLFGPVPGARHDQYTNNQSLLIQRLADCQAGFVPKYASYRDKAYTNQPPYAYSAYAAPPAPAVIDPLQAAENFVMKRFRVEVEWEFGKILEQSKFLECSRQKIHLSAVGQYYICAALHSNTHTCLNSGQAGVYFQCRAPRLGEYFRQPTVNI